MRHAPAEQPHPLLEAYLDGLLEEPDLREFEHSLRRDDAMREAVTLQRAVDGALARSFIPPPPAQLRLVFERAVQAREAAPPPPSLRFRPARLVALAASLILAVCGVWMLWHLVPSGQTPTNYHPPAWRPLTRIYHAEIAEGFEPDWVCENEEEFRESFRVYGQPLLLRELPAGTEALGLGYTHAITPWTTMLLSLSEGEPVVVFIDRLELDRGRHPIDDSKLHLHRRVIGELVAYELSPFKEPRVLPFVYHPKE